VPVLRVGLGLKILFYSSLRKLTLKGKTKNPELLLTSRDTAPGLCLVRTSVFRAGHFHIAGAILGIMERITRRISITCRVSKLSSSPPAFLRHHCSLNSPARPGMAAALNPPGLWFWSPDRRGPVNPPNMSVTHRVQVFEVSHPEQEELT
jgi:hypothetical protein